MATDQHQFRIAGTASRRDALKLARAVAAGCAAVAMTTGLPAASAQASPAQTGPSASGRFSVEIAGVIVAGVQSVEGIESDSDVVEYKEGGSSTVHFEPGDPKPGTMHVTRDWSNTGEFYNWRKTVLNGQVQRKSISVIFHNDAGEEAGRLNFFQCWPSKWTGPSLNAKNSAHATESLEIVWETLEVKTG